jgi:hypothetical protein
LADVFGSKVAYPNATLYDASLASYWSQQEAQVDPACVFKPTCNEDAQLAVFLLHIGGKRFPGKYNFAVRSGGYARILGLFILHLLIIEATRHGLAPPTSKPA